LTDLLGWLSDPHYGRRSQAARTLVNRKEQPGVVWPALQAARADDCWMVRIQVPRAAVHLGIPAEQAVPVLRELLGDADEVVRGYAAWALGRFGQGTQAELLEELVRQGRRKPSKGKHAEQSAAPDRGRPPVSPRRDSAERGPGR
jgi:HEAT repeat protein